MSESGSLDQLCDSLGISTRYRDHMGVVRQVPEQTLRSLLKSLKSAAPEGVLPPVIVHRQGGGGPDLPRLYNLLGDPALRLR